MNVSHSLKKPHIRLGHSGHQFIHLLTEWVKRNVMTVIAIALAVATAIIVPPDSKYLEYFDLKTLSCLFCTLAVVCAFKNIRFFTFVARKIVSLAGNVRAAVIALVYITFIGSMIIANDMALLTFLPLGYIVLSSTGKEKYMAFTFIMQNISANLGGMLTPFGNPQNLYLYEKFNIPTGEFMGIMLIPFAVSIALVTLCCLFIPKDKLSFSDKEEIRIPVKKAVIYGILFVLVIASVFRVFPYWVGLAAAVPVLLIMDRDALKKVDYPLLLTFAAFFVFSGNMARIDAVDTVLTQLLEKNTLLVSVASCQVMSNVPSAILLSQFTADYPALLIGVNIGGAGTLIASLASLITFREYTSKNPGKTLSYVGMFSAFNFGFLAILTVISTFLI